MVRALRVLVGKYGTYNLHEKLERTLWEGNMILSSHRTCISGVTPVYCGNTLIFRVRLASIKIYSMLFKNLSLNFLLKKKMETIILDITNCWEDGNICQNIFPLHILDV